MKNLKSEAARVGQGCVHGTLVPGEGRFEGAALPSLLSHATPSELERFMRSELSPRQTALVVAHLLGGCRKCLEQVQPLACLMFREEVLANSGSVVRARRRRNRRRFGPRGRGRRFPGSGI